MIPCSFEAFPKKCISNRREAFLKETIARPARCGNCKVGRAREEAAAKRRKGDDEPILLRCTVCGAKTVKPNSGSKTGRCVPCGIAARDAAKGAA